jgi:alkanesulfonate monooxygenase SsuD/methylene tetrahydromethanopterin reductase-like flavin-dependent oxidoreductase (luciferase family)
MKKVLKSQINHAILADEIGVDRLFQTEHHFWNAAAEYSPNPLINCSYLASATENIKLAQLGCVLPSRDPIRFAERAAMLDILSDGRAEIGISRGYQPRETETLGAQYFGGTVQDNEKNRKIHEEKVEILLKAWTEDLINYDGEFHSIPPSYTKWHHRLTKDYFDDEVSEYDSDEVLDWKEESDIYAGDPHPAIAGGTTLKKISVFPQPLQEPYPQVWQPIFSPRSAAWVATKGFNTAAIGLPPTMVPDFMDVYYTAAEEAGYPHRLDEYDGEPLNHGWDEEKNRGFAYIAYFFNTDVHDEETFNRWKRGMEHTYSHYSNFALAGFLVDMFGGEMEDYTDGVFEIDKILEAEMAFCGDTEELIEICLDIADTAGYKEDFHLGVATESGSLKRHEENEQLEHFMEHVVPHLEEEYPSP